MQEVRKVVIIGPESTGKSTLCETLAKHYNTLWCPEYAREYLLANGTNYSFNDLLDIAKGQLSLEDEYLEKVKGGRLSELLFVDTDMYVMKVWCEFVFSNCHQFIIDKIVERKADLYLLCNIDLPWVKDELREYPDVESREKLYHIYRDIMINQSVPWINVHGDSEERSRISINAIDNYFFATGV